MYSLCWIKFIPCRVTFLTYSVCSWQILYPSLCINNLNIIFESQWCFRNLNLERISINWIDSVSRTESCVCSNTGWYISNTSRSTGVGWVIVDHKVVIVSVAMELTNNCVLKPVNDFGIFSAPCSQALSIACHLFWLDSNFWRKYCFYLVAHDWEYGPFLQLPQLVGAGQPARSACCLDQTSPSTARNCRSDTGGRENWSLGIQGSNCRCKLNC